MLFDNSIKKKITSSCLAAFTRPLESRAERKTGAASWPSSHGESSALVLHFFRTGLHWIQGGVDKPALVMQARASKTTRWPSCDEKREKRLNDACVWPAFLLGLEFEDDILNERLFVNCELKNFHTLAAIRSWIIAAPGSFWVRRHENVPEGFTKISCKVPNNFKLCWLCTAWN